MESGKTTNIALRMTALPPANELIEGFRNGSESSVRRIYDEYYRPLCYFATRLIGVSDEAEDIAVECFLKLLSKRQDFERLPDIKSFLFTAVRNACFDHLRRKKTKDRFAREQLLLSEMDEQFGQDEMLIAKTLQLIYAEIEVLPQQCKNIFKSIYFDGKTTGEVATDMGLSKQTVLNQKSKALHLLRLKLYNQRIPCLVILLFMKLFIDNSDC